MKYPFLFLASILILNACSESIETRIQRYLIQGNEKIQEQEYDQAEKYFNEALKLDSCFSDALNNLGTVYHRRGNSSEAVKFYSRAIQCSPEFLSPYFNRANVYYETNQLDAALTDLRIIEQKAPDTTAFHQLKALVSWKAHDYEEALIHFHTLLLKQNNDRDILINIGTIHNSLRDYDSARHYLDRALAIDKESPEAWNTLALIEAETGNIAQAEQAMGKALAKLPKDAYFLNNQGYILLLKGQYDEALPFINESISLDPYNGWAYRNKGIYYFYKENYEEAIRLFTRAEAADPLIDKLYYWLAATYLKMGNTEKGCPYYAKAIERNQVAAGELKSTCE